MDFEELHGFKGDLFQLCNTYYPQDEAVDPNGNLYEVKFWSAETRLSIVGLAREPPSNVDPWLGTHFCLVSTRAREEDGAIMGTMQTTRPAKLTMELELVHLNTKKTIDASQPASQPAVPWKLARQEPGKTIDLD